MFEVTSFPKTSLWTRCSLDARCFFLSLGWLRSQVRWHSQWLWLFRKHAVKVLHDSLWFIYIMNCTGLMIVFDVQHIESYNLYLVIVIVHCWSSNPFPYCNSNHKELRRRALSGNLSFLSAKSARRFFYHFLWGVRGTGLKAVFALALKQLALESEAAYPVTDSLRWNHCAKSSSFRILQVFVVHFYVLP